MVNDIIALHLQFQRSLAAEQEKNLNVWPAELISLGETYS